MVNSDRCKFADSKANYFGLNLASNLVVSFQKVVIKKTFMKQM